MRGTWRWRSVGTGLFRLCVLAFTLTATSACAEAPGGQARANASGATLKARFSPPAGYTRVPVKPGSFGAFLRGMPLKPDGAPVLLHSGKEKWTQSLHAAVIDYDVGKRDLQQCADAVMRMRAEYLWAANRKDEVCFKFTSGHPYPWAKAKRGYRAKVSGNKVDFVQSAKPSSTRAAFRAYLDRVYTYAGTASLTRELKRVQSGPVEPGDVYIQPGFPGHAVLVVDVAQNGKGERVALLAQSYMPAQSIHVLQNQRGPWFFVDRGELRTPEWRFEPGALHRFGASCAPKSARRSVGP